MKKLSRIIVCFILVIALVLSTAACKPTKPTPEVTPTPTPVVTATPTPEKTPTPVTPTPAPTKKPGGSLTFPDGWDKPTVTKNDVTAEQASALTDNGTYYLNAKSGDSVENEAFTGTLIVDNKEKLDALTLNMPNASIEFRGKIGTLNVTSGQHTARFTPSSIIDVLNVLGGNVLAEALAEIKALDVPVENTTTNTVQLLGAVLTTFSTKAPIELTFKAPATAQATPPTFTNSASGTVLEVIGSITSLAVTNTTDKSLVVDVTNATQATGEKLAVTNNNGTVQVVGEKPADELIDHGTSTPPTKLETIADLAVSADPTFAISGTDKLTTSFAVTASANFGTKDIKAVVVELYAGNKLVSANEMTAKGLAEVFATPAQTFTIATSEFFPIATTDANGHWTHSAALITAGAKPTKIKVVVTPHVGTAVSNEKVLETPLDDAAYKAIFDKSVIAKDFVVPQVGNTGYIHRSSELNFDYGMISAGFTFKSDIGTEKAKIQSLTVTLKFANGKEVVQLAKLSAWSGASMAANFYLTDGLLNNDVKSFRSWYTSASAISLADGRPESITVTVTDKSGNKSVATNKIERYENAATGALINETTFAVDYAKYANELQLIKDATIASGETLTIPAGMTLTIPTGKVLTNNGTIVNNGTIIYNGTIKGNVDNTNGIVGVIDATGYAKFIAKPGTTRLDGDVTSNEPVSLGSTLIIPNGKTLTVGMVYFNGKVVNNGTIAIGNQIVVTNADALQAAVKGPGWVSIQPQDPKYLILTENVTIGEGSTLEIGPSYQGLVVPNGKTLTVKSGGCLLANEDAGSIQGSTLSVLDGGTLTVEAGGTATICENSTFERASGATINSAKNDLMIVNKAHVIYLVKNETEMKKELDAGNIVKISENITLNDNYTVSNAKLIIPEDKTLTIATGKTLTIGDGSTLERTEANVIGKVVTGNGKVFYGIKDKGGYSITEKLRDQFEKKHNVTLINQNNSIGLEANTTLEIPAGVTLVIPYGKEISIESGVTLINKGTIIIYGSMNLKSGSKFDKSTGTVQNNKLIQVVDVAGLKAALAIPGTTTFAPFGTITLAQEDSLTISIGATLAIPDYSTIVNNGTITNNGTIVVNGKLDNKGTFNIANGGILEIGIGAKLPTGTTTQTGGKIIYDVANEADMKTALSAVGETFVQLLGNNTVSLTEALEIPTEKTLIIASGATLTIPTGVTLTNNGTIVNNGTIEIKGTLNGSGTVDNKNGIVGVNKDADFNKFRVEPGTVRMDRWQNVYNLTIPKDTTIIVNKWLNISGTFVNNGTIINNKEITVHSLASIPNAVKLPGIINIGNMQDGSPIKAVTLKENISVSGQTKLYMDPNYGILIIPNGKTLTLEPGAYMEIGDSQGGSSLQVERGGSLIVQDGAQLVVESASLLARSAGATITGNLTIKNEANVTYLVQNETELRQEVLLGHKVKLEKDITLADSLVMPANSNIFVTNGMALTIANTEKLTISENATVDVGIGSTLTGTVDVLGKIFYCVGQDADGLNAARTFLGEGKNVKMQGSFSLDSEGLTIPTDRTFVIGYGCDLIISDGTTLTNNGTLINNNTLSLYTGFKVAGTGTITNNGQIIVLDELGLEFALNIPGKVATTWGYAGDLTKAVEIKEGSSLEIASDFTIGSGGKLTNNGYLKINANETLTNNGAIVNAGTITNDGTYSGEGTVTNNGILNGKKPIVPKS